MRAQLGAVTVLSGTPVVLNFSRASLLLSAILLWIFLEHLFVLSKVILQRYCESKWTI
jgi:hypothetical protein